MAARADEAILFSLSSFFFFLSLSLLVSFLFVFFLSVILDSLDQSGYVVTDLSSNEMAKVHGRYLCGGRSSVKKKKTENELLYRYVDLLFSPKKTDTLVCRIR